MNTTYSAADDAAFARFCDCIIRWQIAPDVVARMYDRGVGGFPLTVQDAYARFRKQQWDRVRKGDVTKEAIKAQLKRVRAFVKSFHGRKMASVSVNEFSRWASRAKRVKVAERNFAILSVHAFYSAFTDEAGNFNPAQSYLRVKVKSVPHAVPVDDLFKLLDVCLHDPEFADFAQRIVCIICLGLRPEQARRLHPEDVKFDGDECIINLPAFNNRKAGERTYLKGMSTMFRSFFSAAPKMSSRIWSVPKFSKVLASLYKKAGVKRVQKGELRDSFGSYHLKLTSSLDLTAYFMTHLEPKTALRYYVTEVSFEEAARFFAMRPGYLPAALLKAA